MTSVLVIDDHPIVLEGCRRVLKDAGIETVLEARDLVSGYRLCYRRHPDVVVIDIRMRGKEFGGLSLIRRISRHTPRPHILVLSMFDDPAIVSSALEAGAFGYLLKDAPSEELVKAVEQVRAGKPYLSHQLAVGIVMRGQNPPLDQLADLTQRQLLMLTLLSHGKSYDLIAHELGVSYKTVVNIGHQLRLKLGVGSRPELIRKALDLSSKLTQSEPGQHV
jgi:two-component system, NarL family, invasion response regulator UvrY